MVLALIPIVLWLLVTGRIPKLKLGEFEIQTAFVEASKAAVAKQITPVKLPVESIIMEPKAGIEEIPRLIKNKTEALFFRLGHGGYYGPAIQEYLKGLSEYPFFKYVIIVDSGGKFFGMADARELNSIFLAPEADFRSDDFAQWLNRADIAFLSRLPRFVSANDAIREDTGKQTALERMEALNVETLPVTDEKGKFAGVVDRSRLTASLIIDVSSKLK